MCSVTASRSLYQRLLGDDWDHLDKPLQRFHGSTQPVAGSGVFRRDFEGPVVLVPENKHYSWQKGVSILGIGREAFWAIELDERGKLSLRDLEKKLEQAKLQARPVLLVVSVAGTTELGEFDPVDGVANLLDRWRTERGLEIWHHVDGAYGGFFRALSRLER